MAELVKARMRTVDPDVRIMYVAPLSELRNAPLARPRFNAFLIGVFAGVALLLAAIGLYAVMAAAGTRLLQSLLFSVSPFDLTSIGGAALLLVAASAAACYVPARRATEIDPIDLLRAN